jgi:hypothetical protein
MADGPVLRVVDANASPEEVAAIVAAVGSALGAPAVLVDDAPHGAAASRWVAASRLSARRMPLRRGEWRLSGRIGRRAGP